jgi:hypothetical protein
MAQQVGDTVQQRAQQGAQAVQGATDTFAAKSQAANLGYDPSKAPTAAKAKELAATTYTGPKDWGEAGVDTADVTKKVTAGADAVQALGSAGGVASLLRESYRAPTTAGASGLDAALAGGAGGARFQQLNASYGDLSQRLISARGAAGTMYDANLAGTKDAAAQYGTLAGTLAEREAAARAEALQASGAERAAQVEREQQQRDLQDGQWSQDEAYQLDDIKSGRARRRRVGGD